MQEVNQSHNNVYSDLKSRFVAEWSVDNMNHYMTPNGMLLDVCVSLPK